MQVQLQRRPGATDDGPEEAAAAIAAIAAFTADTAVRIDGSARVNPWVRAALREAADREPLLSTPWGDPHPWGKR